ncbi:hypothetical protein QT970_03145 [Microcoleus sp. herbarium8]|uniref:hypothetical protein n=1 Tax=Microcoleus sp. herbarium8 TaxID=3055436 RepID=UPI002FD4F9B5
MMTNDCGAAAIDTLMPLGDNKCDRLIVILTGIFSRDGKMYGWQICDRLADCVQNLVSTL